MEGMLFKRTMTLWVGSISDLCSRMKQICDAFPHRCDHFSPSVCPKGAVSEYDYVFEAGCTGADDALACAMGIKSFYIIPFDGVN